LPAGIVKTHFPSAMRPAAFGNSYSVSLLKLKTSCRVFVLKGSNFEQSSDKTGGLNHNSSFRHEGNLAGKPMFLC
jgi:hypothetical protein